MPPREQQLPGPTGLEAATSGVTGRRSDRLNYDPVMPVLRNIQIATGAPQSPERTTAKPSSAPHLGWPEFAQRLRAHDSFSDAEHAAEGTFTNE